VDKKLNQGNFVLRLP